MVTDSITKTALRWTPQSKRPKGKSRKTSRWTVDKDPEKMDLTWGEAGKKAKDRAVLRNLVWTLSFLTGVMKEKCPSPPPTGGKPNKIYAPKKLYMMRMQQQNKDESEETKADQSEADSELTMDPFSPLDSDNVTSRDGSIASSVISSPKSIASVRSPGEFDTTPTRNDGRNSADGTRRRRFSGNTPLASPESAESLPSRESERLGRSSSAAESEALSLDEPILAVPFSPPSDLKVTESYKGTDHFVRGFQPKHVWLPSDSSPLRKHLWSPAHPNLTRLPGPNSQAANTIEPEGGIEAQFVPNAAFEKYLKLRAPTSTGFYMGASFPESMPQFAVSDSEERQDRVSAIKSRQLAVALDDREQASAIPTYDANPFMLRTSDQNQLAFDLSPSSLKSSSTVKLAKPMDRDYEVADMSLDLISQRAHRHIHKNQNWFSNQRTSDRLTGEPSFPRMTSPAHLDEAASGSGHGQRDAFSFSPPKQSNISKGKKKSKPVSTRTISAPASPVVSSRVGICPPSSSARALYKPLSTTCLDLGNGYRHVGCSPGSDTANMSQQLLNLNSPGCSAGFPTQLSRCKYPQFSLMSPNSLPLPSAQEVTREVIGEKNFVPGKKNSRVSYSATEQTYVANSSNSSSSSIPIEVPCPSPKSKPNYSSPSKQPNVSLNPVECSSSSREESGKSQSGDSNASTVTVSSWEDCNTEPAVVISTGGTRQDFTTKSHQGSTADQSGLGIVVRNISESGQNVVTGNAVEEQTIDVCAVCGDISAGFHCGAQVCEACKKFFVRSLKQKGGIKFSCPRQENCRITKDTRTQCQFCRYKKCVQIGMYRPGGTNISQEICHIPCKVCGAPSSGYHFGAITCEGCKGFFRRSIRERDSLKYRCGQSETCVITTLTRNVCKLCRYKKCVTVGMTPEGSRIGRQPNLIRHVTLLAVQDIKGQSGTTALVQVHKKPDEDQEISCDIEVKEEKDVDNVCCASFVSQKPLSTDTDISSDSQKSSVPEQTPEPTIIRDAIAVVPSPNTTKYAVDELDDIITQLAKGYSKLDCINTKSPKILDKLTQESDKKLIWDAMMTQFSYSAMAVLKFAKDIPGFRKLPVDKQIGLIQLNIYPVVLSVLSTKYCLKTDRYNYFNMDTDEENAILSKFPTFRYLLPSLQSFGQIIQQLLFNRTEMSFLCGLALITEMEPILHDKLAAALHHYCASNFGPGNIRFGLILLRLPELTRASQMHLKAVIELGTDREKYGDLEIPQLFNEIFSVTDTQAGK